MMRRLAVATAATLLLGLGVAQAQDYTLTPIIGQIKLNDGFSPDPTLVDITVGGGTIDGTMVSEACNGFITDAPTYRIFYTAGANPLSFTVESDEDTTLIISDPDGNWLCGDDDPVNFESLNPVVTIAAPLSGQYDIWVGTYSQIAEGAPATLVVTAQPLGPTGGMLDFNLEPIFGTVDLPTGFTPDPQTFEVEAGGQVDVEIAAIGDSCWGFVTEAPTLRVNYTAGSFPLFISAVAGDGTDLVLIINDPEGNWTCDDDSLGELNPLITFDAPLSGQYDIWVGTYDFVDPVPVTLSISEVQPDVTAVPSDGGDGPLNWELPALYGEQDFGVGVGADPVAIEVTAGGDIDAMLVNETCYGFVTEAPTYRIFYTAGDLPLVFAAFAQDDTTLIVADPAGEWFCDDDSAGFPNPQITFEAPLDGVYDIWVGTYGGAEAPATLTITEGVGGAIPVEPSGSIGAGILDFTLTPTFGEVALDAGFLPDPHEVPVTAGGQIDVAAALPESACWGFADTAPTYRLTYAAGSFPLAIYVLSDTDTTLVINGPDGEWLCDDDSGEGLNPAVYLEAPVAGQYDIWVATYNAGTAEATLFISETVDPIEDFMEPMPSLPPLPSPGPAPAGTLDPGLAPNFGEVTLTAGFSPDPHTVEMTPGGDIAATEAVPLRDGQDPGCRGYVTEAPDYRLQYTAGAWPLIISVLSETDTTLVINGPDGAWYCDDDTGDGLNPLVQFDAPATGQYDIWVGTYGQGQLATTATLRISEIGGGP